MLFFLACSSTPNIVHRVEDLAVGDTILVCHREAPAFQAAAYTCGPEVKAVKGPLGPGVSGVELLAAIRASGFDPAASEVTLMKHLPRQMPDQVAEGGVVIEPGVDGTEWFSEYVYLRSDGRKVLYLSRTR